MATVVRWDPFREMDQVRGVMDRIFEDTFGPTRRLSAESGMYSLALDVIEKNEAFLVKATVPGIDPDNLDITLTDGVLTIKGETREESEKEEGSYHLRERRFGSFMRSVSLPANVRADAVEADYSNGVLTLTLPKADEVLPKKITVRTNGHKVVEG